jgi:hypothetical protein
MRPEKKEPPMSKKLDSFTGSNAPACSAFGARHNQYTKMNEPKLKLALKPCGDCWLHIDAPSGLKASINLGQRGSMNDQTIVGRTIREVAALHEDKPTIPEPNVRPLAPAENQTPDANGNS